MEEVRRYDRTKRCPFCAEEILIAAIKCKHCHADLSTTPPPAPAELPISIWKRPVTFRHPVFGILGTALVIAWLAGAFDSAKTSGVAPSIAQAPQSVAPSQNEGPQHEAASQTPGVARTIYRTTATKLYRDYESNEVATDQKIGGALVEVSGTVKSIDKDMFDQPEIKLDVGDDFNVVALTMDRSQLPAAGRLSKGQSVKIRCERIGRIIDLPTGNDCQLVN